MLINLLRSSNYIMINKDAIKVLGINCALYCSELLNMYEPDLFGQINEDDYIKLDRELIAQETGLSIEDQLKCDANLSKVNIIKVKKEHPDMVYFNIDTYSSLLVADDIKTLGNISSKVKVNNPKGTKQAQRDRHIIALKESIECNTYEVLTALRDWIDSIMTDPKKYLSTFQVKAFKDTLDDYCNGDLQKALDIIHIASIHNYIDCQWAINMYEKDKSKSSISKPITNINVRTTKQKKTIAVGDEVF